MAQNSRRSPIARLLDYGQSPWYDNLTRQLTVDVRGSARHHGGEARLAELIRRAAAGLTTAAGEPIDCGVGIADGPFAATIAARAAASGASRANTLIVEPGAAADFLAPHPVALAPCPLAPAVAHDLLRSSGRIRIPGPPIPPRWPRVGNSSARRQWARALGAGSSRTGALSGHPP